MKDKNMTNMGSRYGAHLTEYGVWVIKTQNVCCYLLEGSDRAMLIDTAYGKGDLRTVVEEITSKPLIVVNTHSHFDHSGGNGFWETVWMGEEGHEAAARNKKLPYPNYEIKFLTDGQVFDLGNRKITCHAVGAHHPGSFAFYDESYGSLFTGDEVDPGQVLLNVRGDSKETKEILKLHHSNMQKLKELHAKRLLPAHNGTPLDVSYLEDFLELSEGILAARIQPCKTVAGYGFPPLMWGGDRKMKRYRCRKASFVCSK